MAVRRLRTGTLAGTLAGPVLLVALTGCGGDDSVADPPVSSATSSPTQSPQRESPEHFIRRWAEAEKRMENTGDTRDYVEISRSCKPCMKLAKEVEGFYQAGGFVRWGGWTIKSIDRSNSSGQLITFVVRIDSAPTNYKESSSARTKHLDGGPSTELLTVGKSATGWIMKNTAEQAS